MLNNRILLKGNLTRDPEYKTIAKDGRDSELVAFRVAVNETIGGREETVYFDVDGWNNHSKYAQSVFLSKGDRVIIDGRVRQREWTDKNGSSRTSFSVVPNTFSKVVKPTVTATAASDT